MLSIQIPVALAALVSATAASLADIKFCNQSSTQIDLSIGYCDLKFGWTSQGWLHLPIGACIIGWTGELPWRRQGNNREVYSAYYYGTGENGVFWGDEDSNNPKGNWFCTSPSKFLLRNKDHMLEKAGNTLNCEADGLQVRRFQRIEFGGQPNALVNLHSPTVVNAPPSPPAPPPPASAPVVPPGGLGAAGTACQRFPNLCVP